MYSAAITWKEAQKGLPYPTQGFSLNVKEFVGNKALKGGGEV